MVIAIIQMRPINILFTCRLRKHLIPNDVSFSQNKRSFESNPIEIRHFKPIFQEDSSDDTSESWNGEWTEYPGKPAASELVQKKIRFMGENFFNY